MVNYFVQWCHTFWLPNLITYLNFVPVNTHCAHLYNVPRTKYDWRRGDDLNRYSQSQNIVHCLRHIIMWLSFRYVRISLDERINNNNIPKRTEKRQPHRLNWYPFIIKRSLCLSLSLSPFEWWPWAKYYIESIKYEFILRNLTGWIPQVVQCTTNTNANTQ